MHWRWRRFAVSEHLYSTRMVASKRKTQINKQQTTHTHTHNKHYVQLQQATKMAKSIIQIIIFGNKLLRLIFHR